MSVTSYLTTLLIIYAIYAQEKDINALQWAKIGKKCKKTLFLAFLGNHRAQPPILTLFIVLFFNF